MNSIIHVDMDAFYAAVEVRDNAELAGKPLIIGSLPHERGVVATASYEARKFGIHSGQSIKDAYRRCPHGIYMHPNFEKYTAISRLIREIWDTYTDLIECIALDEGYLDITQSAWLFGGAEKIGRDIKKRTLNDTGLTCSVGIGYSMMSAKTASEEDKPDGFFVINSREALLELIGARSVRAVYGIGTQTAHTLDKQGIRTVYDIINNAERVKKLLGKYGESVVLLANGEDNRRITASVAAKSIGKEHTFQEDITDFEYLRDAIRLMARKLGFKIRRKGLFCKTVTLKVTFSNMKQITRSKSGASIQSVADIFKRADVLLSKVDRQPIRLIGISVSNFAPGSEGQLSLFEATEDSKVDIFDRLLYNLQCKYGIDKFSTGSERLAEMRLYKAK
jgi:DNA polymerase-4/DNA polymerase IV (DinB-like DNA polymerase)